jgi:hypothetical protein
MWWIILTMAMILLLLLPIRVKLTLIYENNKINIYIFNKQINKKAKIAEEKVNSYNAKKLKFELKRFMPKNLKKAIFRLKKNKIKPRLKMSIVINYGFDDAAVTGISYGILHSFSYIFYNFVSVIFKIKNYNFEVNPYFNTPMLNLRITGIISSNLVQIIYMLIIIYRK